MPPSKVKYKKKEKEATAADIIRAREEGRLLELLPSGANIPFTFSTGEENSFDVGRDGERTYLILHDCMDKKHTMNPVPTNEGGWPACGMRRHVQELFGWLPEEIRKIAIPVPVRQKAGGETVSCSDMAFILSASQVFGDEIPDLQREYDCYDGQIDIFRSRENRVKPRAGASGASWWWLRSANYIIDYYFKYVRSDGSYGFTSASGECGVVVGLCVETPNHKPGGLSPADMEDAEKEKKQFEDACYRAYQLDWMISHGYGLNDLREIFTEIIGQDLMDTPLKAPADAETVINEAECAVEQFMEEGFNGSLFACREEFLQAEYRDEGYMRRLLGLMPEPEKMLSAWRRYSSALEISRILSISTGHVRKETAGALDGYADMRREGLVVYAKGGYGWWIRVPEFWPDGREAVPFDLAACISLAAENGCEWLCLDRDGMDAGLPVYKW